MRIKSRKPINIATGFSKKYRLNETQLYSLKASVQFQWGDFGMGRRSICISNALYKNHSFTQHVGFQSNIHETFLNRGANLSTTFLQGPTDIIHLLFTYLLQAYHTVYFRMLSITITIIIFIIKIIIQITIIIIILMIITKIIFHEIIISISISIIIQFSETGDSVIIQFS